MPQTVQSLDTLLENSAATPEFKAAVRTVLETRRPAAEFQFSSSVPAVKAVRAVSKLLEEEPELVIQELSIRGSSGCSDFEGQVVVNNDRTYDFRWCCAWRAKQEGWTDHWGAPDQIRAAREYGYQCFERFQRIR